MSDDEREQDVSIPWDVAYDSALSEGENLRRERLALRDVVMWMSAASDFDPGGRAHGGWLKARRVLDYWRDAND